MNFLFGRKPMAQAMAEVLEDGQTAMDQEMKKPKYKQYAGPEVFVEIAVRVQPEKDPSFAAKMKTSIFQTFLLKPGVRVRVKYDPRKTDQVDFDDNPQAVLDRNPQLKKE